MPEKAFSSRVEFMDTKLLDGAGWSCVDGSKQGINLEVSSVGEW
jgi:hypothetical protein